MPDYSTLHTETERRIAILLADLRATFTPAEIQEVQSFLAVSEYGLALETLAGILVEEHKPFSAAILKQIDDTAGLMGLDGGFLQTLHATYESQHAS